jgi:hypothetical protein
LESSAEAIKSIEWTGEGSLISPETRVAVWQQTGNEQSLPNDAMTIEGLAAGKLEFAGPPTGDPANSRLRRWVGPSMSDEPPGIDASLPQAAN